MTSKYWRLISFLHKQLIQHNDNFALIYSLQANNTFKRPSPDPYIGNDSPSRNNSTMKPKAAPARKPKASKKKKKKDPNEPQK